MFKTLETYKNSTFTEINAHSFVKAAKLVSTVAISTLATTAFSVTEAIAQTTDIPVTFSTSGVFKIKLPIVDITY